jgi:E3 ubiquitin-protein ligase listerin
MKVDVFNHHLLHSTPTVMPKAPNKSSASKATLKKKAAKKAAKEGDDPAPPPQQRSTKGLTKAEKKAIKAQPKVYVPPPKPPAAVLPDPLDAQGLARTLPAELVVVLRRLGKKDAITRRKGLDELRLEWVEPVKKRSAMVEGGDQDLYKMDALIEALPVWVRVEEGPGLLHR